jgi:hypothetical protein
MDRPARFALGVGFGLLLGLIVVEFGTFALVPVAVFGVIGTSERPFGAWLSGLLFGAGGLWLAVAVVGTIECSAPDRPCGSPNLLPLTVLGLTVAFSGLIVALGTFRRRSRG